MNLMLIRSLLRTALVIVSSGVAASLCGVEARLTESSVIELADEQSARESLAQVDAFIRSLSPFDRAARVQSDRAVSQQAFIQFASAQALPWTDEEARRLTRIIESISQKIAPFAAHFPQRIRLVKTSGREEAGAAYCRNLDTIVFPQAKLRDSLQSLEDTLIHELFHILSRNNAELRDSLYAIVGFQPCPGLDLPEILEPLKITNPDAPVVEHYIEVSVDDQIVPTAPVLLSRQREYDAQSGRTFFDYLTFRLLVLERNGDRWQPALLDGEPRLLDVSEVRGFHDQIGWNTRYIIHPEEILADNFVLLVNGASDVPSPEILERMRALLTDP